MLRVYVHYQRQGAAQIVEHHHFFGHHQQDIRRADIVVTWRSAEAWLYVAHRVIAEVTHQTTTETLLALQWSNLIARLEGLYKYEGVVALQFLNDLAVGLYSDRLIHYTQHCATRQADDGETSPLLAALDRLEEISVQTTPEFEIGGQWRL